MSNLPEDVAKVIPMIQVDQEQIHKHLDDLVRESVEQTLNGLLDAEADALCGAKRYERSPERLDTRAGHYSRKLHTKAGEVTLNVPKLRNLPFETAIIERYRRRETSVEEALVEMYLAGVSTRRVEDITEALWGTRVSSTTVSELNKKIYTHIEAWRNQPIQGEHPYVYLDGIWLKRCWGGEVRNIAVLVAVGVNQDGFREVLGVMEGARRTRRVGSVSCVISRAGGSKACCWSLVTSAWGWSSRWLSSTRKPAGSVVRCISTATCLRRCPTPRSRRWQPC
jgi:putative transposase